MAAPRLALLPLLLSAMFNPALAAESTFGLKPSGSLSSVFSIDPNLSGPAFFDADRVIGFTDSYLEAEGDVTLRNLREQARADWMRYDKSEDLLQAKGNVVFTQQGYRVEGDQLKLRLTPRLGEMSGVRYSIHTPGQQEGRGQADKLLFQGKDRYELEQATYTTCPVDDEDWVLRTRSLQLDYPSNVGSARDVRVEYKGVPLLYAPWMDFALDDQRKSGFLTPSIGASDKRGIEVVLPWYWNIAPNRDATFTPRLMSKRGVQLNSEFRYLEKRYQGDISLELLPRDIETGETRYHGLLRHQHNFTSRLSGSVLLENVSDDTYFSDLSSLVNETSRVNLPRDAVLNYNGDWWHASGRIQRFQTLQDPKAPIIEPYHRVPQLLLNATRADLPAGLRFDFASEFVRFEHGNSSMAAGNRFYAYPNVSLPLETTYGFLRPKLGWHYTRYDLDRNPLGGKEQSRSLPVVSLDGGLVLERDWSWHGRDFLQTLEPRAYFVKIPNRDQSEIPVFDSALADLSLAQLFTENQFTGVDRINDANQLTLAVTSRFLESNTGLERLQVTLGQRYYFNEQRVTLPGTAARGRDVTDLLAQVSGQITDTWRVTSGIQYNPDGGDWTRANVGAAYRAGPGRLVNADFRYINDKYAPATSSGLNQLDLSWQWPLKHNIYSVGRFNYSFRDDRLVEGLLGFEYNAGCWSLRSMVQQLATTTEKKTSAFFLQLELRGLTKLGPNPLDILKRSISGYTKSDEIEFPE